MLPVSACLCGGSVLILLQEMILPSQCWLIAPLKAMMKIAAMVAFCGFILDSQTDSAGALAFRGVDILDYELPFGNCLSCTVRRMAAETCDHRVQYLEPRDT